jgi:hypothetical protein
MGSPANEPDRSSGEAQVRVTIGAPFAVDNPVNGTARTTGECTRRVVTTIHGPYALLSATGSLPHPKQSHRLSAGQNVVMSVVKSRARATAFPPLAHRSIEQVIVVWRETKPEDVGDQAGFPLPTSAR